MFSTACGCERCCARDGRAPCRKSAHHNGGTVQSQHVKEGRKETLNEENTAKSTGFTGLAGLRGRGNGREALRVLGLRRSSGARAGVQMLDFDGVRDIQPVLNVNGDGALALAAGGVEQV